MITLGTECGLIKIDSWDDVLSRPGYRADVDPRTMKLHEVIGSYRFMATVPCGLSTCHQPHLEGYLVLAADGTVTNLGNICGNRYFGVRFSQLRRVHDAAVAAQNNRECLGALKNRLPGIVEEVRRLRTTAEALNRSMDQARSEFPSQVLARINEMNRLGSGRITVQRALTGEERDRAKAASDVLGMKKRAVSMFDDVEIGFLAGYEIFHQRNSLRALLVEGIEPLLAEVDAAVLHAMSDKALGSLAKRSADVEPLMQKLRNAIDVGHKLFVRQNLEQLAHIVTSPKDKKAVMRFAKSMPDDLLVAA